ncbi:uncharacterized protein BDR25DRAFT_282135 [Lindgomyces ingoldianus]|uniref:Uncharacterized protein n=1 Tax=Lindgomyces ingoldianus TaxID=673940 RepID=A0ACB6R6N3_9PLEO|nr:uncharacterized protein BDR25DRAFT_282135 [Lindgomyces ingoldianus]KAF2473975.1 hypothetical protein BDR25DRAFT_282135 [Lindgomyces ingoldianus]
MELDLSDPEPSVLEYARFHGLCTYFSQEQPCPSGLHIPSNDHLNSDLQQSDSEKASLTSLANQANSLTKERLTVSRDVAFLLKFVHSLQESLNEAELYPDPIKRISPLKQEVPIPLSDPELDLQNFGSMDLPDLGNLKIPFERASTKKDEGLEWPANYYDYPIKYLKQVKFEKLTLSKQDLIFLHTTVQDTYTCRDSEKIEAESIKYTRNPALQPLTPPLLPISPQITPYVPSSPANHLELLSESSNSGAAELEALDEHIVREDALVPPSGSGRSEGSDQMLLEFIQELDSDSLQGAPEPEPSPILKRKIQDLKVEGPLTPPIFHDSQAKKIKSVSFPEMLHEYIPDLSNFESGDDILNSQESFSDFYKEIVPVVEEVNKNIENEKLSEVDTTRRVDVPDLDFSLPTLPWEKYGHKKRGKHPVGETELDAQTKFILQVKRNDLRLVSSWHGLAKLERDLHWSPFPTQLGVITINEKLQDDGILGELLAELSTSDIATSSTDIWKRDQLRFFDDEEDREDELEVVELQEGEGVESFIRKKRLEIEDDDINNPPGGRETKGTTLGTLIRNVPHKEFEDQCHRDDFSAVQRGLLPPPGHQQAPMELDGGLMFGGMFSASVALHKFMKLHGRTARTGVGDESIAVEINIPVQRSGDRPTSLSHEGLQGVVLTTASREVQDSCSPPRPTALMLPPTPTNLQPCSFIISSTLLQQRTLTRQVEKIYKDAELMERDFSLLHSPSQEADLLLSPSTGLILTSLQQIKQRALPGQPDRSPIKERISKLQLRYERLIVLVSEGVSQEVEEAGSRRLADARDPEALKELEVFSSKMEADVMTKYIEGGELALSRAIVGEMAGWGLPHGSEDIGDVKLLQEETLWELFLRRAGFNPFAAQVILASLKTPYDLQLRTSSPPAFASPSKSLRIFGLPAFILMSAEERVEHFQVLLGGGRILNRVSTVLDQSWPSAVNGFAV